MKNLDLNGLGFQEFNVEEMHKVDGGWFLPFVAGAIAGDAKIFMVE